MLPRSTSLTILANVAIHFPLFLQFLLSSSFQLIFTSVLPSLVMKKVIFVKTMKSHLERKALNVKLPSLYSSKLARPREAITLPYFDLQMKHLAPCNTPCTIIPSMAKNTVTSFHFAHLCYVYPFTVHTSDAFPHYLADSIPR